MRSLLPGVVEDVDVHAYYGAGWLDRGGLRVNFVAAVDGAAQANGKSEGLQTPGDNVVFAALRDLADVVLVGAGTVTAEGYGPITVPARRKAIRRAHGLKDTLPLAVQSRSLRLDPEASAFTEAVVPTIVLTCAAADPEQRRRLKQVAEVVDCGDERVEGVHVRRALEERGLTRVLSEGGPTVFADLVADRVVDELCLTLTPRLVGPGPGRITAGNPWPAATALTLVGLLEEDGALFGRYTVG